MGVELLNDRCERVIQIIRKQHLTPLTLRDLMRACRFLPVKEEAQKVAQLRQTYGDVRFYLFLCGYFDSGYLGYEAAEGIDWIWEHRMSDMEKLGL